MVSFVGALLVLASLFGFALGDAGSSPRAVVEADYDGTPPPPPPPIPPLVAPEAGSVDMISRHLQR